MTDRRTAERAAGVSSLGVPGLPWHPQILADQLTLSRPRGQIMPKALLMAPPDFRTFLRAWRVPQNIFFNPNSQSEFIFFPINDAH